MEELADTQSQQESQSFDIKIVTAEMMRVLAPEAQDLLALIAQHMQEKHNGATPPFGELIERGAQNRLFAVLVKDRSERVGYAVATLSPMLTTGKVTTCIVARYVRPEYRSTKAYRVLVNALVGIAKDTGDGILLVVADEIDQSPVPWMKARPINATWMIEV